ncbi:MAG: hypothetical protein EOQ57_26895 [Mesorhizobium sp.]|uniref:SPW repeat protein n=1 Tax=Mesorhizobium sp. TaxID=1871066 RepID=UPI000FE5358D|nr:SPW repeat protein [Mesorhizobium sp.]RWB96345.1 MAG: hypothetical protein EOQ57_26895 [Mesorhizobium sp.]
MKGFLRAMIALWTLISPWVLVHLSMAPPSQLQISASALWNFLFVGVTMMVISITQLMAATIWEGRVNVAMGIWLIVSPWVLGFRSDLVLTWNAVMVGILAIVVSGLRG